MIAAAGIGAGNNYSGPTICANGATVFIANGLSKWHRCRRNTGLLLNGRQRAILLFHYSARHPSTRLYRRKEKCMYSQCAGYQLHLTFEVSGQAGFIYDSLMDCVDSITVSNPSKMTWIYRTAKKNDRLDARKQAILLSIGEIPAVHMPTREVRQWRQTILHRKKTVSKVGQVKNRIRVVLKSQAPFSHFLEHLLCFFGLWAVRILLQNLAAAGCNQPENLVF